MKNKPVFLADVRTNFFSYLLALPAILFTLIFGYCTIPYMIIAFQKYNFRKGLFGSEFVGFKNFEFFFKSNDIVQVIVNTIKLNFLFIGFTTLLALVISVLLNELSQNWMRKFFQSSFLFPYFMSWVVISYMLYSLLSYDHGLINNVLEWAGLKPLSFYTESKYWTPILVMMKMWKDFGLNVIIYLAVITGFDTEIYEAARIDGANRWQVCTRITTPLLMTTVSILTIIAIGKIFYGDFGMIYALVGDNGVLYETTDVIDTFMFRTLRTVGNPSQAMAVGLFQAIMGFILVCGTNYIVKKRFREGALF